MTRSMYAYGKQAVAIVGAACRLPGGIGDLEQLWLALCDKRDLVSTVPADRFEVDRFVDEGRPRKGKSYTSAGGFLDDLASFDTGYFGISPREAAQMDPQHRLLLELAVEGLDDAGIAPSTLAGSDTAVYVGISDTSYGALQMLKTDTVNPYTMSGAASSIAANRLSHFLDLQGPSMVVDTACSSALVALDRACRTLLEGTSRVALCGGVNALLSPYHYIGFSQASMLSPSGRCRSFSAHADGYVRAEGAGLVVLKLLEDALAAGDRVHGIILASAANNDGRTMGLALPNPDAQEKLLRQAYELAGVHPDELVYLEAHGTGTPVGDPIECLAIGRALGARRTTGALPIGSVKSNMGHLEPASGMAGLFKGLLVLRHGRIPASLHADPPSPDIDFAGLNLTTVAESCPVGGAARPVVGVNSFGFGGANAHVVLAAPPDKEPRDGRRASFSESSAPVPSPPAHGALPVVVSARSEAALAQAVARLAEQLGDTSQEEFYDIAYTSCRRREWHPHRAAVLARDPVEAMQRLTHAGTVHASQTGGVALVFSGNGAQWAGMGADLLAEDATFRVAVEQVDAELAPRLGWSVTRQLALPATQWRLEATEVAQPMLFAVQVGVVHMLRARGIQPVAVVGHSVGEVAAAYAAGALSLAQAAQVVAERSKAQAPMSGSGRMAALGLPPEQARELLARYPGVTLAAVNSDRDVTVAGPRDQLKLLSEAMAEKQVFCRELDLDYAFHSAAMDPVRQSLAEGLAGLRPSAPTIAFVSTVTGRPVDGTELDADYWWRNVREPVSFAAAIGTLLDLGLKLFVEVSPKPVLQHYLRRITGASGSGPHRVVSPLRQGGDGAQGIDTAVATMIGAGADVDWDTWFPTPGRVTRLPAYPWQRERHWSGEPQSWVRTSGTGLVVHPLLGERLPVLDPTWYGRIEPVVVPWLADHWVGGSVLMPATAYVEMILSAGRALLDTAVEIQYLEFTRPMTVPWGDQGSCHVQVSVSAEDGIVTVACVEEAGQEPVQHARGQLRRLLRNQPPPLDVSTVRARLDEVISAEDHYRSVERTGIRYGPAFRGLRELHRGRGEVLAAYRHDAAADRYADQYHVHPALLDAALQAGIPLLADLLAANQFYLPTAFDEVRVWNRPATAGWVHVRHRSRTESEVCWDITVTDEHGTVAVEIRGCRLRRSHTRLGMPLMRHHMVLRAAPRPAGQVDHASMASPHEILSAAAPQVERLRDAWRRLDYERIRTAYVKATAHCAAAAFRGLLADPAEPFHVDDLITGGMRPSYRPLVELLAAIMGKEGVLQGLEDGRWRLSSEPLRDRECLREMARTLPAYVCEVSLFSRVAWHLPQILRGMCDPLELLVPEGAMETFEQFYDTAPVLRFHNRLAQALMRQMVACWPVDRPLRILEVGAGTGGLTAALAPLLPAELTHYTYTDITPAFFNRARKKLAAYDFFDYRTLNLDADLAEQGFTPGTFDMVIAGNALHTAADLSAAVRRTAGLLAPDGRLLAIETHDPEVLALLFGTLDSFWNSKDRHLRPHSPLLTRERWTQLLQKSGFTDIVQTGDERHGAAAAYSVILARAVAQDGATATAPDLPENAATWIILAETAGEAPLVESVAARLRERGHRTVTPPAEERVEARLDALDGVGDAAAVVLVLGGENDLADPTALVRQATRRAALMRTAAACADRHKTTAFWLVTRPSGVHPAPERPLVPADAAAWGVARTLGNEEPHLHVRRVSLDRTGQVDLDADRLVAELADPGDEDEIVLTRSGRFVPRMVELPAAGPATESGRRAPYRLQVREHGLNYRLAWAASDPARPGPREVAIEVAAAALNYRDIMQATGLLPAAAAEDSAFGQGVGMEYAGVVIAVGSEVSTFSPGDRVVTLAAAEMGSQVVAADHLVSPIPDSMAFAEAVTMPVAFLTVHHSLGHLARLQPGETVLVHGAAGGVGMAALQYAEHLGARVIATAGSAAKRDLLHVMGVEHVLDSRDLRFAEDVRELTAGRGVDVVLNSLSGEAITRGLEALRPGGRFIELGKRDIYENKPVLLRPLSANITFATVDLSHRSLDPGLLASQYQQIVERVAAGVYRPLPHRVYPAARAQEAFHLLQHSRHTGKVVVSFDPLDETVQVERRPARPDLNPDNAYLVVGGLSGFGAATTRWLAERGARHLHLIGRRGAATPEAPALLEELAALGVQARVHTADVTDPAAMRQVLDVIDNESHPLRGVVHSAMRVDDDLLVELSDERFAASIAPKLAGAAVLHALTLRHKLDFFLFHSSSAGLVGQPRQANYVAGNLYMEALARHRRDAGHAGLAIAWGALGDDGYIARNGLAGNMARLGIGSVSTREAMTAAGELLCGEHQVVGVGRYDWGRLRELVGAVASPRLSRVIPPLSPTSGHTADELAGLSPAEAERCITEHLAAFLAEVFQMPVEQLDHHRRLDEYGMDSLMGAELLVMLREQFGLDIPPMELVRSAGTIAGVARIVATRLGLQQHGEEQ